MVTIKAFGWGEADMADIQAPITASAVREWHHSAAVVIVGLGMAGTCAALEAHAAGADVLVLERASGGGGASATSEGIFYLGGGTQLQRDCGYEDTPESLYAFMRASTSTPDEERLHAFCAGSVEHFDWLEAHDVPFERRSFTGKAVSLRTGEGLLSTGNEKIWPYCEQAQPAPRGHQTRASIEQGGGAAAMAALLARFEAQRIPALYDTAVLALVVDGSGCIVGVKARQAGTDLFVQARAAVILAAGSFNLNAEMTAEHLPIVAKHGRPLGIPSNDGAGVLLGRGVGAVTEAMDGVIATASIYPPADLIKGIVVNRNGERFVNEDVYHGRLAYFIERQPEQTAYLIVDSEIFAYPEQGTHRLIDGWETVHEMEIGLGVPQGSLMATLNEYNRDAAAAEDRRFHKRPEWLKPLDKGPYAAFDLSFSSSTYAFIALGGLKTDVEGRALDAGGQPIEGLYAVGACAAHFPMNGGEYASGQSLGPGSFFGRRAGRHAAARAGDRGQ
jgi:3-oxo-5alpha-steroid 4-dehydrogenase